MDKQMSLSGLISYEIPIKAAVRGLSQRVSAVTLEKQ